MLSQSPRLSLRCAHCGDVIGAYEPMVVVLDDAARRTSAAADPQAAASGEHYHDGCFAAAGVAQAG